MAAHYIGIMAQKLMLFDENLSLEEAHALAWDGLKGTIAWNNLPQSDKESFNSYLFFISELYPVNCSN
ncbi:MAG: hypothetical protein SFU27_13950 [Thermonemataceae bacterium]|nr:hypothetical protein [Thermonemataceae bacterium]